MSNLLLLLWNIISDNKELIAAIFASTASVVSTTEFLRKLRKKKQGDEANIKITVEINGQKVSIVAANQEELEAILARFDKLHPTVHIENTKKAATAK